MEKSTQKLETQMPKEALFFFFSYYLRKELPSAKKTVNALFAAARQNNWELKCTRRDLKTLLKGDALQLKILR